MLEMASALGLAPATLHSLTRVLSQQPWIESAEVFGSRAKGNYQPGSDIDIALRGRHCSAAGLLHVETLVDALDLPYRVDLAVYSLIDNPALRQHIDRVGKLIYQAKAL